MSMDILTDDAKHTLTFLFTGLEAAMIQQCIGIGLEDLQKYRGSNVDTNEKCILIAESILSKIKKTLQERPSSS